MYDAKELKAALDDLAKQMQIRDDAAGALNEGIKAVGEKYEVPATAVRKAVTAIHKSETEKALHEAESVAELLGVGQ